jgi:GntR family transcriptional repressor for pyruvate dehydrogenase complex
MSDAETRIQPISRLTVSSSVAAELERMILEGEYKVGDQLPSERILAEQFGVGRSSMREALRIVEVSGLLRVEHGIGMFVAGDRKRGPRWPSELLLLDGYTVPELFEVRLALEPEAAALAAKRRAPSEAAELERIVAAAAPPDLTDDEFIERDSQLHRAIVMATQNALLLRIFDGIEPLFVAYSHRVIELAGRRVVAHFGHEQIVGAVVSQHGRAARTAMLKHLREVERDIVDCLKQATSPAGPGAAMT